MGFFGSILDTTTDVKGLMFFSLQIVTIDFLQDGKLRKLGQHYSNTLARASTQQYNTSLDNGPGVIVLGLFFCRGIGNIYT
jgi:hypothetical protein